MYTHTLITIQLHTMQWRNQAQLTHTHTQKTVAWVIIYTINPSINYQQTAFKGKFFDSYTSHQVTSCECFSVHRLMNRPNCSWIQYISGKLWLFFFHSRETKFLYALIRQAKLTDILHQHFSNLALWTKIYMLINVKCIIV